MGCLFTILGAYTSYRLWDNHNGLAIFTIVVTLYEASSLNEMMKEKQGKQPSDNVQTFINLISSVLIIGLFIYSFFQ